MADTKILYEGWTEFFYKEMFQDGIYIKGTSPKSNDIYYWTLKFYVRDSSGETRNSITIYNQERLYLSTSTVEKTFYPDARIWGKYLKQGEFNFYLSSTTYDISKNIVGEEVISLYVKGAERDMYGVSTAPVVYDNGTTTYQLTGNSSILIRYMSDVICMLNPSYNAGNNVDGSDDVRFQAMNDGYYGYNVNNGTKYGWGQDQLLIYEVSGKTTTFSYQYISPSSSGTSTKLQTTTYTNKIIDYKRLTCNTLIQPIDANGRTILTIYGAIFDGSFGLKNNSLKSMEYYYRTNDTSGATRTYDVSNIIIEDGYYRVSIEVEGLDPNENYSFIATVKDELMTVTSSIETSSSTYGSPTFDWSANDFKFNVPVDISDGDLTITRGNLILNGEFIYNSPSGSMLPETGEWNPVPNLDYVNKDFPTDGVELKGNYLRIADLCYINFYINITPLANSSSTSRYLMIGGLPFKPHPDYGWQSGGGTASGYRIEATEDNNVFCGWSIEKYTQKNGLLDPDTTGYYIFGKTAEIDSVSSVTNATVGKKSYYLSAVNFTDNKPLIASGTIMYKVAEGE